MFWQRRYINIRKSKKIVYSKRIGINGENDRAVIYDIKEDTSAELWAPGGWSSNWSPDDKYVFIMGDRFMKDESGKSNSFTWTTVAKAK
ncbi:MAG: hypothetical protein N4A40_13640 [Tissierellales bacterium]|jgi:hypothetical protein|nr:hypothetical protein [Tissierellales bacterium]